MPRYPRVGGSIVSEDVAALVKPVDALEEEAEHALRFRKGAIDERSVQSALGYFGVSRNFPGLGRHLPNIVEIAAEALERARHLSRGDHRPGHALYCEVDTLAENFASVTGRLSISAASKLLWLGCGYPFVIYDQRAREALQFRQGRSRPRTDYCAFYMDWQQEFQLALCGLPARPNASMSNWAALMAEPNVHAHEFSARVFDKQLWEEAGKP